MDRLVATAGVEPMRIERWDNSISIAIQRDLDGSNPRIRFGTWWAEAAAAHGLCTCGHSNALHGEPRRREECTIDGCDCEVFRDDGSDRNTLVREAAEAILAHEVAHRLQDKEGWPRDKESREAEFDADRRAIEILGNKPEQMIRTLRLGAWTANPASETHPTNEERVLRIREQFDL